MSLSNRTQRNFERICISPPFHSVFSVRKKASIYLALLTHSRSVLSVALFSHSHSASELSVLSVRNIHALSVALILIPALFTRSVPCCLKTKKENTFASSFFYLKNLRFYFNHSYLPVFRPFF